MGHPTSTVRRLVAFNELYVTTIGSSIRETSNNDFTTHRMNINYPLSIYAFTTTPIAEPLRDMLNPRN